MTNHVHLLATPREGNGISRLMQSLGRYTVRYVNQTYGSSGTLWEGRYKSTLIDSDNYFLVLSRYIELNPVRAQMVKHPAEYSWSDPTITSVSPTTVEQGQIFTITGTELYPGLITSVVLGGNQLDSANFAAKGETSVGSGKFTIEVIVPGSQTIGSNSVDVHLEFNGNELIASGDVTINVTAANEE